MTRRDVLALPGAALAGIGTTAVAPGMAASAEALAGLFWRRGLAMHGEPALPVDLAGPPPVLPYGDPAARRGGRIVLAVQGTFDSLNPFVVKGVAPEAVPRFVLQSLMMRSADEPFSLYGLVAREVAVTQDRGTIAFRLDERAAFADGAPLTAEDVRFTFDLLKAKGKPFHRSNFSRVAQVSVPDARTIVFRLARADDRELPLLIGLMPIFARHATDPATFDGGTLAPILGSGPYQVAQVKPGESVLLSRSPNFWAAEHPLIRGHYNPDEIRYDFYRDANTMFEAFKAGLYDLRFENDPTRWTTGYDIPAVREGRILREALPIGIPKGMNAFVLNTRRPQLSDIRVREALGLMFDFEWVNRNLFGGAYRRTASFFEGSDLASTGRPLDARESALLAPFAGAVAPAIAAGQWAPPSGEGSGRDRERARRAIELFAQAGYVLRDGVMAGPEGEPFTLEMMAASRPQERLALNFAQSLERIGIRPRVRLVDDVQYWRRLSSFDFDVVQFNWSGSPSPGSEQINRWGSAAAGRQGSLNYAGARSPAIDAMIAAMLAATSREDFVSAVRALDRVLLSGFYVVPLFHKAEDWIARRAEIRRPEKVPLFGLAVETLWRSA
jgi:peptide/nickel transport system substrate-binding protein